MVHLLLTVIYLSFISLGLPDALLGAAWPSMYGPFGVPVSFAGCVSMIIALGTVVSRLQSSRLTRRFGAGRVTAASVGLTALALLGFSLSGSFWQLCLWAVPYGLGAGAVDAALNNYVALHYASRHMSWLHCMWGLGASLGPYFMGHALTTGRGWPMGYRWIAFLQIGLTAILVLTLPLWRIHGGSREAGPSAPALTLPQVLRLSGAKSMVTAFFCYCGLEQTAGLWASSYLTLEKGLPAETAAGFASLFFLGVTAGRGLSGFLTLVLNDRQMVRLGQGITALGVSDVLPESHKISHKGRCREIPRVHTDSTVRSPAEPPSCCRGAGRRPPGRDWCWQGWAAPRSIPASSTLRRTILERRTPSPSSVCRWLGPTWAPA